MFRSIKLYVNDKEVGEVANGGKIKIPVEEGNYKVRARIDWCGSRWLQLNVKEGDEIKLLLEGFAGAKWMLPLFALSLISTLGAIYFMDHIPWQLYIVLYTPFLYLVYLVSLGRNQYLRLRQV